MRCTSRPIVPSLGHEQQEKNPASLFPTNGGKRKDRKCLTAKDGAKFTAKINTMRQSNPRPWRPNHFPIPDNDQRGIAPTVKIF